IIKSATAVTAAPVTSMAVARAQTPARRPARGGGCLAPRYKRGVVGARVKTEFLKKTLKEKTFFIADVTPKEMEKSCFRVTRAYSPDLLDLEHSERELFSLSFKKKRVDEVNAFHGSSPCPLNLDPHCFP
ncbi:MAG: hypothetical protein OXN83_00885, partial [Oligoflexia bacterium]|nr:hypothetical protein [Oligoflexia bacterium]